MGSRNKYGSACALTARDFRVFWLLWHAKVLTTAVLARWIFPDADVATAHRRLWMLKRHGWLTQRPDRSGECWYWTLTKKSYARLELQLPDLFQEGFETEWLDHDARVAAVHFGSVLAFPHAPFGIIPEQWLRRVDKEFWPEPEMPQLLHRPDGYWHFPITSGYRLVALEVERQPKKRSVYLDRFLSYEIRQCVSQVIWVVDTSHIARVLAKTALEFGGEEKCKSSIFLWKDFLADGFHMRCRRGRDVGRSFLELLLSHTSRDGSRASRELVEQYFFDGTKSGRKSARYRSDAAARGFDCIPAPALGAFVPIRTPACPDHPLALPSFSSDGSLKTGTLPAVETPEGEHPWLS